MIEVFVDAATIFRREVLRYRRDRFSSPWIDHVRRITDHKHFGMSRYG